MTFKKEVKYFGALQLIDSAIFALSVGVVFFWSGTLNNKITEVPVPAYCVLFFFLSGFTLLISFALLLKNAYPFLKAINITRYFSVITKILLYLLVFTINHFFGFISFSYYIFATLIVTELLLSFFNYRKLLLLKETTIIEMFKENDYSFTIENYDFLKEQAKKTRKMSGSYIVIVFALNILYTYFSNAFVVVIFLIGQIIGVLYFFKDFWLLAYKNFKKSALVSFSVLMVVSVLAGVVPFLYKDMTANEMLFLIILPLFSISNLISKIFGNYFAYQKMQNYKERTEVEER